jgi:hypothetical protein
MTGEPAAGRMLDALVHERLFHQSPWEGEAYLPDLPYYSTDLAASWQVAGRLRELGYRIDVDTWAGGGTSVTLTSLVDGKQVFHGSTPAEAICRAAVGTARL